MGPDLHQCRGPPFGTRIACMRMGVLDVLNQEVDVCVCVFMGAWMYVLKSSLSLFFVIMLFISLEKSSLNVR